MYCVSSIIKIISDKVTYKHIGQERILRPLGVKMLESEINYDIDYVYIAEAGSSRIQNFIKRAPDGLCLFVTGHYELEEKITGKINIISVNSSLIDLYTQLTDWFNSYHKWATTLSTMTIKSRRIQSFVNAAASLLRANVFLCDISLSIINSNTDFYSQYDDFIEKILRDGYIHFPESVKGIVYDIEDSNVDDVEFVYAKNKTCYLRKIIHNHTVVGTVAVVGESDILPLDIREYITILTQFITPLFLMGTNFIDKDNREFQIFMSDVLNEHMIRGEQIQQKLISLSNPLTGVYRCIVVRFNEKNKVPIPYRYLLSQLADIFEKQNITVFKKDIIILYASDDSHLNFSFDVTKFTQLLNRYDAYAGVSAETSNPLMLRSQYLIACQTAQLGKYLKNNSEEHMHIYEDYSMYVTIDLCAQQYEFTHHNDNILHLAHPAILKIIQYDEKNNANLFELLICYLSNDRNLIKTANEMYMHRNTIANKITKIHEITGENLEDGKVQSRFMYSCQLIKYYTQYMHKTISYDETNFSEEINEIYE